jgi:Gelsolin repeat
MAPRLYALSDAAAGAEGIRADEVPNFAQSDLVSDDVMLLDTGTDVFVWLGTGCSADEKDAAPQVAKDFIAAQQQSTEGDIQTVRFKPATYLDVALQASALSAVCASALTFWLRLTSSVEACFVTP